MKRLKRTLLRVFFGIEIIVFTFVYLCGSQGIQVRAQLKKETCALQRNVMQLHTEVDNLQKEIVSWDTDDFYKEKLARERLGMARKGEIIFFK